MKNDVDLAVRIPRALKDAIERDIAVSEARLIPSNISTVVRVALAEYLERRYPLDSAREEKEIAARAKREIATRAETRARKRAAR